MINQEFSIEFDILYNNISSNQAPGLTEYEKSVFLTAAQEDIVTELYTGRNSTQNSFEETEELRRYLNSLIVTHRCPPFNAGNINLIKVTNKSTLFNLPDDVLFITKERVLTSTSQEVDVYPISQDELSKILKNPFRGPSKTRALKLDAGHNIIEIIYEGEISYYNLRYIKKPNPIILVDLEDDLSINGQSEESECELDSSIHRTILERAVALALQTMYSK